MNGKQKKDKANRAVEFPALREFVSGYLHQDFADEYGSAAEAAKAFCQDASEHEIVAVRKEWNVWRESLKPLPLEEIAMALRKLGAAWRPETTQDLDSVELALKAG